MKKLQKKNKVETKKKQEEGITLIALVITIVVLLILAGISIAMLTGQNGILTQVTKAKEKTEKASLIEQVQLDILEEQTKENGSPIAVGTLQTILNKYFSNVPTDANSITIETPLTAKEEYGGYNITLSEIYNGKIEKEPITAADVKASDYGAIVNGYTCTNSAGVNAWKIFYADNNNIYLISDDYIPYEYIPSNSVGHKPDNGNASQPATAVVETELQNDYVGSSSITDEKIKALNNDYFTKGYTSTSGNWKAVAYILDTNAWSVYAGDKAEYAVGAPTIELLFNSYNKKYGTNYEAKADSNLYQYQIRKDDESSWSGYLENILNTSDSTYVISSTTNANGMWIASPSDYVMYVFYNGGVYSNYYDRSRTRFSSNSMFKI